MLAYWVYIFSEVRGRCTILDVCEILVKPGLAFAI